MESLIRRVQRVQELKLSEQIRKQMATSTKTKAFIVGDKLVKHGDVVKVKWGKSGSPVDAMIYIDYRNRCYVLQNERDGSAPIGFFGKKEINHGYTCSWSFNPGDIFSDIILVEESLTTVVPPLSANNLSSKNEFTNSGSRIDLKVIKTQGYDKANEEFLKDYDIIKDTRLKNATAAIGESYPICYRQPHPDCCGASVLYSWSAARKSDGSYNSYRFITDDDLPILKSKLGLGDGASKIAHLADYQYWSIQLVERLGFKKVHSFTNRNSGNVVNIYQYD